MSVEVDTTRLNRIIHNSDGEVADVIATIAFAIERLAKVNAPVDTGALRSSIYTKLKTGGHEPAQRDGVVYVDIPEPESELEAIVGPTVEYGIWVELGTSRMAAQPFLTPAVEQVTNDLARFHGDMGRALSG
jgi:HK97 gp10 family phage protein